ncbi:transcription factor [Diplodia corticola]|uniref:Transcription factor n=1 Tax=Diplodia corticola TaxID=236234 RepID=A0A1J9R5U6_9PEZI|nr:transcription factor [Diplodia corticola]OJD35586.1 transcription factor [Diplodia corticola]
MSVPAKGERFYVNFDDPERGIVGDRVDAAQAHDDARPVFSGLSFVADVKERDTSEVKPPAAPSSKSTSTGFPAHKKRTRISAFKQQRNAAKGPSSQPGQNSEFTAPAPAAAPPAPAASVKENVPPPAPATPKDDASAEEIERRQIDEDNKKRLAAMTPEEIEAERQELFSSLNPAFIQRLLARANIDEGSNERSFPSTTNLPQTEIPPSTSTEPKSPKVAKKVTFEEPEAPKPSTDSTKADDIANDAAVDMSKLEAAPEGSPPAAPAIHFPRPLKPPELDPNDPNFLQDLHDKYFPDLAADPQSLLWAAPLPTPGSEADRQSPYHPSLRSLDAKDVRFGFNGAIIPPKLARDMAVNLGLHHHGEAPEAAGYTIPELALLARSKVPAQRCMAFQTLGRILFRLGRGEFGIEGTISVEGPEVLREGHEDELERQNEKDMSMLARGLWECVEEHRVIDTLSEEVNKQSGHLTAKTFAEEALWNWRKGGGRKKRAV